MKVFSIFKKVMEKTTNNFLGMDKTKLRNFVGGNGTTPPPPVSEPKQTQKVDFGQ